MRRDVHIPSAFALDGKFPIFRARKWSLSRELRFCDVKETEMEILDCQGLWDLGAWSQRKSNQIVRGKVPQL